jgi:hypothetical protein
MPDSDATHPESETSADSPVSDQVEEPRTEQQAAEDTGRGAPRPPGAERSGSPCSSAPI